VFLAHQENSCLYLKRKFHNLRSKIRVCWKKHDMQCGDCGGSYCDGKKHVAGFRVLNGNVWYCQQWNVVCVRHATSRSGSNV
jgi:hypothetical protein